MEECDLNELFDELTEQFIEYQQRFNKQHIQLVLQAKCGPSNSVIVTDKVKLKQIFVNLITNAFKFTFEGTIEGGCIVDNNKLIFYVSDTGIGIPADKQQFVFERFTQLQQGKYLTIGGTGLGLSIIQGLVSLLGGEIFLDSEAGKGSTFSFTFPCKLIPPLEKTKHAIEDNKQYIFTDKTILIVEDELYTVEYLKELLESTGSNLLFAQTGKKAIQIASAHSIDLILMDIRLPDIDGYEVSRQIRQHNPKIKIIAQTAFAANSERQKALNEGLNDYISKPIKRKLLLPMMKKHLIGS